MTCTGCNERLEVCACPDAEQRIEGLKECKFLDPQMIVTLQMARASNKHIIEKKRANAQETKEP